MLSGCPDSNTLQLIELKLSEINIINININHGSGESMHRNRADYCCSFNCAQIIDTAQSEETPSSVGWKGERDCFF